MRGVGSDAYAVIDFVALLIGYAVSSERTWEDFYDHLLPFALPFMSLFGRDRLPARSTLSRFLAALTPEPVEALRTLFLADLLARPLDTEEQASGLWDRAGTKVGWSSTSMARVRLPVNGPCPRVQIGLYLNAVCVRDDEEPGRRYPGWRRL